MTYSLMHPGLVAEVFACVFSFLLFLYSISWLLYFLFLHRTYDEQLANFSAHTRGRPVRCGSAIRFGCVME
jgi:hypothetical protein